MKKHYISPEALCEQTLLESLLSNSIENVDYGDLSNPIGIGGDAASDTSSDSRRRSVWDDEEFDTEYDEF